MPAKHTQTCSIASFLNVFGDAWTMLIIREAFYGATRFSEFQRNTGIAKNLLSDRLALLVDEGVMERENIGDQGVRFAYHLTAKGRSLVPVFVAIVQWSNEHLFEKNCEPVQLLERGSRKPLKRIEARSATGDRLRWKDILAKAGPGANNAARERIAASEYSFDNSEMI